MMGTTFTPEQDTSQGKFFYGWVIALIGGLAYFFSGPGQTYSFSAFVDPMIAEFGWSRSLISSLYSGGTLIAGLTLFLIGSLVDRYGCRLMLSLVSFFLAGSCFVMSGVTGPITLFGGILLIRIFGVGSLELIPSVLIPQWFRQKRGRAFWITSLGLAVSSALFPVLNVILIRLWGWRSVWWFWGILLITVMAPLAWGLVRNRPEDMGLLPDNKPVGPVDRDSCTQTEEKSWSFPQVIRMSSFWIIVVASSIPAMVLTGLSFHQLSILAENGLSVEVSSSVFAVTAIVHFIALGPSGWIADRFDNRFVLSATLVLMFLSTLLVIWTTTPFLAVLLGVLRGMTLGVYSISINTIWPNYYGRAHLARIRGFSMTAMVIASAFGPMPFGVAFDWFGGYREMLLIMSIICLVIAGITMLARPPATKAIVTES